MFNPLRSKSRRHPLDVVLDLLTAIGLFAVVLATSSTLGMPARRIIVIGVVVIWACLAAEFAVRLFRAAALREARAYLTSPEGVVAFLIALSIPLGLLVAPRDSLLFALFWSFRYVRDRRDLSLFWRIIQHSRMALLSILSVFLVVFIAAATLAYLFERNIQPEAFGSIPQAMWWAIVTLTTTGYGDVVPVTIWGRILAGWVMLGGTVMIALQAGVIATAFAEELKRRNFLHTWDLVMTVPFFKGLGAAAIADIVRLLRRRDVSKGDVIVRAGDPGDAMYFIVSGEAAVGFRPAPVILAPGAFFGEMALLFGTPRSADVVATKPGVLLVLDIADFRELAGRRPEIVTEIEKEGSRRRDENAALHRGQ